MKLTVLSSLTLFTLSSLLINQTASAKDIWLKCDTKMYQGKPVADSWSYFINLDYDKQTFEIRDWEKIYQGIAKFWRTEIKFQYNKEYPVNAPVLNQSGIYAIKELVSFSIDRASLNFRLKNVITVSKEIMYPDATGICKLIPPPSALINKI